MRKVYVLGVGQTDFGKLPQYSPFELGTMAAKAAVKDAGIDPRKIQVAYGGHCIDNSGAVSIQTIMSGLGVSKIEMTNVFNACGTGITATNLLWRDIACGIYDIGIAVGTEAMTTSSWHGRLLTPAHGDLNGLLGVSMPSNFAMGARRLLDVCGATPEDLAYPSYKNHRNASLNPHAMYKKPLTMEDILNSKMISTPITLLECCPFSDGAAAAILCSEEVARQYTTKLICLEHSQMTTGDFEYPNRDIIGDEVMAQAAAIAYEKSGIDPADIDVVELHDAFSPEELYSYESLRLCKAGEGIQRMREGWFDLGGRCPVNPSGGLLALGHPIAASGVRVLAEIVLQLRGDAGGHQVQGARVGLAQMKGGYQTGMIGPMSGGIQLLTR